MTAVETDGPVFSWTACHFSTLFSGAPLALVNHLLTAGFVRQQVPIGETGRGPLGEMARCYSNERETHILVYASGVLLIHARSWQELRPLIASLRLSGYADLAGNAWVHGS